MCHALDKLVTSARQNASFEVTVALIEKIYLPNALTDFSNRILVAKTNGYWVHAYTSVRTRFSAGFPFSVFCA